MGKKRRILLAALIAAVLCGFLWLALDRAEREPMYQGKPLSAWLETPYTTPFTNASKGSMAAGAEEEAETAIRAMGTNALPTLLRMLRKRDSPLVLKLVGFAQKQHIIPIHYVPASIGHQRALYGLRMLESYAASALPELLEIYEQSTDQTVLACMPQDLVDIAPSAHATVPVLLRKCGATNDGTRQCALAVLGRFSRDADVVVPALIKALQDPSAQVRSAALDALADLGTGAVAAVPALLELHQDSFKNVARGQYSRLSTSRSGFDPIQRQIEFLLKHIDPEAAAKAGVK